MQKMLVTVAMIALSALPASAQVFTAENNAKVTPLAGGVFSVAEEKRFGVPGQWCGAADYALRALNADWMDRIYVQRQGAQRAVEFALSPNGTTPSKITVISNSAKTPGANFTVQRAFRICMDQRRPFFFRD